MTESFPRVVVVSAKYSSDFPLKQNRIGVIWLNVFLVVFFFLYSGYRSAARSGISLQIEDLYFVCSICISLSLENSVFLDKITLTPSAPCEDDL